MAVYAYLFGLMLQRKDKNGVEFDIALYNFQKNNIGQISSQTTNFNFSRCTHFLVLAGAMSSFLNAPLLLKYQ